MINHRTITHAATPEEAFAPMQRHHARQRHAPSHVVMAAGGNEAPPIPDEGDIVYGARRIAQYIFGKCDDTTRRRVYGLAEHYRARKEKAGFFRLKGALCLSRSQWARFHGFG